MIGPNMGRGQVSKHAPLGKDTLLGSCDRVCWGDRSSLEQYLVRKTALISGAASAFGGRRGVPKNEKSQHDELI